MVGISRFSRRMVSDDTWQGRGCHMAPQKCDTWHKKEWLTLSHVSDDVIKRNKEIRKKDWKMESHTFGLRKEGRKLPPFDHTVNAPKRRREMQRERRKWGEMKEKKEEK